MIERMEEIKKAKSQIVEGALTIWNARLEALVRAGDLRGALNQMIKPVELADNCSCGNNCGCAAEFEQELAQKVSKSSKG